MKDCSASLRIEFASQTSNPKNFHQGKFFLEKIKVGLFRLNLINSVFIMYTVVGPYVPTTVIFYFIIKLAPCYKVSTAPKKKVLVELFQKLARWRARSPPKNGVFFLIAFSFAPLVSKEKAGKEFC